MSYKYDLAISFAGEQRDLAQQFADRLDASGYSIFFDEFHQAKLWGQELSIALADVYGRDSRYCLVILSNDYLKKPWTNQERRSAISQFIQNRNDYILCLKVDDLDLPGYASTMGYLSLNKLGVDAVYGLLLQKLGPPNHERQQSHLGEQDVKLAREVIRICFRRAIYTRMDSEIRLSAMYKSIAQCLSELQRITAMIHDQALQFRCSEIIRALDDIERTGMQCRGAKFAHLLPREIAKWIDENKLRVVRSLLEIRRAANIPMQLPFSLENYHFMDSKVADAAPEIGTSWS